MKTELAWYIKCIMSKRAKGRKTMKARHKSLLAGRKAKAVLESLRSDEKSDHRTDDTR